MSRYGYEEGETCNRQGCTGAIEIEDYTCCCSTTSTPPCGACENAKLTCDECGWVEGDDEKFGTPGFIIGKGIISHTWEIIDDRKEDLIEVDSKTFKNLQRL